MTTWRLCHLDVPGTTEMRIESFADETAARDAFLKAAEVAKRDSGHIKLLNPSDHCVATFARMRPA